MGSLEGKVAIVTGAASGIGKAVAERFARDGAKVVVADVDDAGGTAVAGEIDGRFAALDVRDLDRFAEVVADSVGAFGRLDIVHLNAGITTGEADVESLSVETYRRAVGVNLDGVVFGVKAALPAMTEGGAFVVTASLAGLLPYPGDFVYGLTKHAVVGFVRSVAEQLSTRGITINAVCPGFVDTPILGPFADRFRSAGFPLLEAHDVAESVVGILSSGRTGEVFICQPGRLCEPYRFRGVPGPRSEGAEGMKPPVRPGY